MNDVEALARYERALSLWNQALDIVNQAVEHDEDPEANIVSSYIEEQRSICDAWDRSPRTGTGRRVATIRITREPRRESTATINGEDFEREGFVWLRANGGAQWVEAVMRQWTLSPREVWVVEFQLVGVVGDTSPRSAARREGTECEIPATEPFQSKKAT